MIKCFPVKVALRKDAFRWEGGGQEVEGGKGGRLLINPSNKSTLCPLCSPPALAGKSRLCCGVFFRSCSDCQPISDFQPIQIETRLALLQFYQAAITLKSDFFKTY